jgi:hypothetical protein
VAEGDEAVTSEAREPTGGADLLREEHVAGRRPGVWLAQAVALRVVNQTARFML